MDSSESKPLVPKTLVIGVVRLMAKIAIVVAIIGLIYPHATDQYSARLIQEPLRKTLRSSPDLFARFEQRQLLSGDPVSRIIIPEIGVNNIVVEGTDIDDLKAGAGHYIGSPLPGEAGNVAIAGHRTTWASPFRHLDSLHVGSLIELHTPLAKHTYRVIEAGDIKTKTMVDSCPDGIPCWITKDNAWDVVDPVREPMLTLTTCHPLGSARQRLIVRAELYSSEDVHGNKLEKPEPIVGPLPPGPVPQGAVPGGV